MESSVPKSTDPAPANNLTEKGSVVSEKSNEIINASNQPSESIASTATAIAAVVASSDIKLDQHDVNAPSNADQTSVVNNNNNVDVSKVPDSFSDSNKVSSDSPIKDHVTVNAAGEQVNQYEEVGEGGMQLKIKGVENMKQFDFKAQSENRYREQWNEIYEHEMIAHSSMDRKRQNLELLRDWDRKRAYFLNVHRSLLETIITEVDIKMQASGQLMQFFIHYFQNKAQQEMHYARSPIPKVDVALLQNESAKTMYAHLKKGLQLLDEGSFEHAKKVSEFAYVIEKEIIQDLLLLDFNDSMNQLNSLHSEINGLKRILMALNDRTSRKSGKVANVYNLSTPKTGYKKPNSPLIKDLYRTQLNFLRHADAQTENQRKLAKATLNFWEVAKDIELIRGKTLSKALALYSKAYAVCYGEAPKIAEASQFIEQGMDNGQLEELFSAMNILSAEDIEFLSNQLLPQEDKKPQETLQKLEGSSSEVEGSSSEVEDKSAKNKIELTYFQITPFFENFTIEKFDNRMLMLKEIKAQRTNGQGGQYVDTHIVITADNYLHCFDQRDQSAPLNSIVLATYFAKPHFSLSLQKAILRRVSTHNFIVELSVQMPGLLNFLAGSNKYFFNFKNSDEIEEMAQFINSLN